MCPLETCTCLVFIQNISTIVNKMANFKHSGFASSAVSNLTLQKNRTMVQLIICVYYVMVIDFAKGCHVLFNRVV